VPTDCYEVDVDAPLIDRATAELTAALVRQNERFVARADRVGTPRVREGLRRVVLVLGLLGAVLCLLLVLVSCGGRFPVWLGWLGVVFFAGVALLTRWLPELEIEVRRRSTRAADDMLARRAVKALQPMLEAAPLRVRYTIDGAECRAAWMRDGAPLRERVRDLATCTFGYRGAAAYALFAKQRSMNPRFILVHRGDAAVLDEAFERAGVALEAMPTTVRRAAGE
jgi:hypothetical protein